MPDNKEANHRTNIVLTPEVYRRLVEKGFLASRAKNFSELVNELVMEYLDNESVNALNKRSKNFINATLDRELKNSLAPLYERIDAIYRACVYAADSLSDTNADPAAVKTRLEKEYKQYTDGRLFHESYYADQPEKKPAPLFHKNDTFQRIDERPSAYQPVAKPAPQPVYEPEPAYVQAEPVKPVVASEPVSEPSVTPAVETPHKEPKIKGFFFDD